MEWEFAFLHGLQTIHTPVLDQVMILASQLGNAGMIWIALSVILACIPKTRRCGLMMMASIALTFVLGNLVLKNLIARARPFTIDETVALLVPKPREYSFPSGHTMNGFTAAMTIFLNRKLPGVFALCLAGLIAFSRMYLFVHYPTDILGGTVLGIADACLVAYVFQKFELKKKKKP